MTICIFFTIFKRQLTTWRGEKVFPNKMHMNDVPAGGFREKYFHFLRQCMVMALTYNRMAPTGVQWQFDFVT